MYSNPNIPLRPSKEQRAEIISAAADSHALCHVAEQHFLDGYKDFIRRNGKKLYTAKRLDEIEQMTVEVAERALGRTVEPEEGNFPVNHAGQALYRLPNKDKACNYKMDVLKMAVFGIDSYCDSVYDQAYAAGVHRAYYDLVRDIPHAIEVQKNLNTSMEFCDFKPLDGGQALLLSEDIESALKKEANRLKPHIGETMFSAILKVLKIPDYSHTAAHHSTAKAMKPVYQFSLDTESRPMLLGMIPKAEDIESLILPRPTAEAFRDELYDTAIRLCDTHHKGVYPTFSTSDAPDALPKVPRGYEEEVVTSQSPAVVHRDAETEVYAPSIVTDDLKRAHPIQSETETSPDKRWERTIDGFLTSQGFGDAQKR